MVRNRLIRLTFSVLAFAGYLALASSAQAGFLPDFTGWTQMSDSSTATAVVDFAVYDNSSHDFASTNSVSTPLGFDSTAKYVYMYEVVNNGSAAPPASQISIFNVYSYDLPYTSSGWLSGTVFSDGTEVGPSANQYLGANPGSMPPDDPANSKPSVSGVTAPTFLADASAVNPVGSNAGGIANSDLASFVFFPAIASGKFSSVLLLTSNSAPNYSMGQVVNGSDSTHPSAGGIPTQAPEPATLAMWGLGALGFGLAARRRKKLADKTC